MSQPIWELIGQLGDAHPIDHGGYFVIRDTTGVYPEEAELLLPPADDDPLKEYGTYHVYRFILDRCTYIDGILSDNKYHPAHPAWWAKPESGKKERPQDTTYLSNICATMDIEESELIRMFCSEDALERAQAYRAVGECHGFDNLDNYPLELRRWEVKKRYRKFGWLKKL